MKIAVTGGSGQLGTLVLRRLAADPHVTEIISLDLKPPRVASAKLKFERVDVRDLNIGRHFEGCDAVIHLAFVVIAAMERRLFEAINVGGSRNVFEAAAAAGVPRIIYSSSIAAYGVIPGHPVPLTEESPRRYQPGFAYSATKYEVEQFLDVFETRHPEIAVTRLRPSILIGTQMEHSLGDALRRGLLLDFSSSPLPIVWDEDVADAVILALKNNAHGAYNVASDDPLPVSELAKVGGLRCLKISPRVLRVAAKMAAPLARMGLTRSADPAWVDNLDITMVVSSEKARRELDWRPRCPRAADVIRHYRKVASGDPDRRLMVFFKLVELASRGLKLNTHRDHLASQIHLALSGHGGGDFAIRWNGGHLVVDQGVPRPPTVAVRMETRTFLNLLCGRLDFEAAQEQGDVLLEGAAPAALVVDEIVSRFREQASHAGLVAWPMRRMAQWFAAAAA